MKQKLLSSAEQYFKTDIRYLLRGGFWLTAAKILSAVASLISSIAFANLLPEETYGVFRYVLSIASLLAIPTLHGMQTALTRSISQGRMGTTKQVIATRLKWGVLGGILSLGVAGYYFYMGNVTLSLSFLVAAIFIPFMDPFHTYAAILNGNKKFNALARDEVATRMSVALLLVGLVFLTDYVVLILFVFFLLTTLFRFFFLQLTLRDIPLNDTQDSSVISYGKHLTLMGIFGRVATQADKILIFHYVGGAALAGFYLAFMPFKQIQNVFNSLSTLAMPKFSANSKDVLKNTLPKKLLRAYLIIIPTVALYIIVAPYLFNLLYPLYPESVLISQLLMLQLLFFPAALLGTAITSQAEKKKLYINSFSFGAIRIILLLALVPAYGTLGAVAAIVLTSFINALIVIFLFFN